ncbi:hypothetical protein M9H77_12886 [Catharanthus roseus]|uniref:Uncharacterized protein n=1 Tax=Catharanthus roseus TaxID=4058 RepID=A0ACC0BIV6_CATRO|nr:hypothetical protein M9H77_12886 [Catharanthus roseus]
MKEIQERNVDAYIYLMKLDPEKWTLFHDGGHRHGIMTTNIFEALNSVLKKARFLRIEMKSREHKVTTYNPREGIYMVRSPIRCLVLMFLHCVEKIGQEQILMCRRYIRDKRIEELTKRIFIRSFVRTFGGMFLLI